MENYNPFSLQSKTILVTGASSGIGRATAIECSKMGATVVITGRNEERLRDTFQNLEGDGHQMIVADLSSEEQLTDLVAKLPKLSGAVFAAGIAESLLFQFASRKRISNIFEVNFISQTVLAQQIIKNKILLNSGSIVFISSIDGPVTVHIGNSIYAASKAAVTAMSKGMAVDLAPKKIRVNCIQPGMTETPLIHNDNITQQQLDADKALYPLGRYGEPEEIAYAAIYLLSDASSFTTGADIRIDGGYTLK